MTINIVGTSSRWITIDFDVEYCTSNVKICQATLPPGSCLSNCTSLNTTWTRAARNGPGGLGVADPIFTCEHLMHSSDIFWLWGKVPPRTIYIHLHHAFSIRFSFGDKNRRKPCNPPKTAVFSGNKYVALAEGTMNMIRSCPEKQNWISWNSGKTNVGWWWLNHLEKYSII